MQRDKEIITLSHGSGGVLTDSLIENLFFKYLKNELLIQKNDATVLPLLNGKFSITTDSFVVDPIFFPGGDIGKLAVCGTVNDLAASGARPLYLTAGFILEEGLPVSQLEKIVSSMANTALEAGVRIIAGDTKVVEKGKADKVFINTTGLGLLLQDDYPAGERARPGDRVLISGSIGDHGLAVLTRRANFGFSSNFASDCSILSGLAAEIVNRCRGIRVMRDPTRGGLATTLQEIARQSRVEIIVEENQIPIKEEVRSVCELLGLDPLYLASEGKMLVITSPEESAHLLNIMRKHKLGKEAVVIGEVVSGKGKKVYLRTKSSGTRILHPMESEMVPRIC